MYYIQRLQSMLEYTLRKKKKKKETRVTNYEIQEEIFKYILKSFYFHLRSFIENGSHSDTEQFVKSYLV